MQQIVDFILELDKLKGVLRKVRPLALDRYENSAEHSWQLALLAISLARYAEGPLDLNRVIRMLLVHDVGEIDAGDVMFFAHVNWEERKAAERAAVTRIFSILPQEDSSDLLQLWHEFEEGESRQSCESESSMRRTLPRKR